MKGSLLENWWRWVQKGADLDLGSVLYRLAEELPMRCSVTEGDHLFALAATTILARRERSEELKPIIPDLLDWLNRWESWVNSLSKPQKGEPAPLGADPVDLGKILRFSAFWIDKKRQRDQWGTSPQGS
jgi:CRISPR-associated protein Cmr2